MPAPLLAPPDVIALSFVPHLPRSAVRSPLAFGRLEDLVASLGRDEPAAVVAADARSRAEHAIAAASTRGIVAVAWGDSRYPARLAEIFDPPFVLWVRGDPDLLNHFQVAIVGSRAASWYGEEAATKLASDLARLGVVITSGLARGIDAAAHRGALAAGRPTIAVLGCGPDVVYPPEHVELLAEVARSGAVVSELRPGTRPLPRHFPLRNRIISGLSLGVVVVEASERSGSLITANSALEQGREVMAVPGNVLSERHRGSHRLLKEGAALVESARDVLDALGLFLAGPPLDVARPSTQLGTTLSLSKGRGGLESARPESAPGGTGVPPVGGVPRVREDGAILRHLDAGEGRDLDAIAAASGFGVPVLLPRLLHLELQGLVRRLPGGRFVRSCGTC